MIGIVIDGTKTTLTLKNDALILQRFFRNGGQHFGRFSGLEPGRARGFSGPEMVFRPRKKPYQISK
ncbi:hypothetical protein FGK63_15540 [Ruegeria sediminis]|uniref:Uncharacterized protein n=1 Tax=Ruegeria sediminis TaxID=2583820 RepID=A0ABY2WVB1_9RHOB|nr:hypothetical protein [Ruegeria sediminis]TMV06551.1 hypothetical protein FGK63_15540 [Ruegeria sediminis]